LKRIEKKSPCLDVDIPKLHFFPPEKRKPGYHTSSLIYVETPTHGFRYICTRVYGVYGESIHIGLGVSRVSIIVRLTIRLEERPSIPCSLPWMEMR